MPFVTPIEPEDAPPEIQRLYDATLRISDIVYSSYRLLAHAPHILRPFIRLGGAVVNPEIVDQRTLELAMMHTSLLNHCVYCVSHRWNKAKKIGIPLEELMTLRDYQNSPYFSPREKAAIALAEELTLNPPNVTEEAEPTSVSEGTRNQIKEYFTEPEIVELVAGICLFNFMNRVTRILDPILDREIAPAELLALYSIGPARSILEAE